VRVPGARGEEDGTVGGGRDDDGGEYGEHPAGDPRHHIRVYAAVP
jgi:hypothetical protein